MAPRPLRLLHLSDLHLPAEPEDLVFGQVSDESLEVALEVSRRDAGRPDVAVATGDLASDGAPLAYRRMAERLRSVADEVLWVPGNHDDVELMAELMAKLSPGGFPRSARVGAWEVILLDSAWPGHQEGVLGAEQLAWLDAHLSRREGPVVVAVHHPPLPACSDLDCGLSDAGELLDVLDRYPTVRVVLSGHNHRPFDVRRGETVFLGAPAVCRQLHHQPPHHAWTDEGPAVRALTLHPDGRVDHRICWVRTPATAALAWWDS